MSTHNSEQKPRYRPCVGIALFNHEGKVFVGERIDTPNAWQMPQGGIDKGEDIAVAAMRELWEEVGTDKAEIIKVAPERIRYDLPPHLMGYGDEKKALWGGRFRGQEQSWVAMRFTGQDSDIDLNVHKKPEFSQWQWVRLEDTMDIIVPFKRDVYRQVIEFFGDLF